MQSPVAGAIPVQPSGPQAQYLMNVQGGLVSLGQALLFSTNGYIVPGFAPPGLTLVSGRTA